MAATLLDIDIELKMKNRKMKDLENKKFIELLVYSGVRTHINARNYEKSYKHS